MDSVRITLPRRVVAPTILALSLLLPSPSRADTGWELEARLQMGFGGEELASVEYTDGSTSSLSLGTYTTLALGAAWTPVEVGPHALELVGLVGWASWSTGPDNTDDRIALSRFPLEALGYYRLAPEGAPIGVRFGGGLTYQFIGGAKGTGSLEGTSMDVANAFGWIAEAAVIHDIFSLSLRYTAMSCEVGPLATEMDASSIGAALGLRFPLGG